MSDDDLRTLDDVFQFLTRVRDIAPAVAKARILEALQLDKLWVDYRVEYEGLPDAIDARVHYDSWGMLFGLRIQDDGRLVVIPTGSVDHPWPAYSFTVANPKIVHKLWPPEPASQPDILTMLREAGSVPYPPKAATQPSTESPTSVKSPPPAQKKEPKQWLPDAMERLPQQIGERPRNYARRLLRDMEAEYAAGRLTAVWELGTLETRIAEVRRAAKKPEEANTQANLQKAHKKLTKPH